MSEPLYKLTEKFKEFLDDIESGKYDDDPESLKDTLESMDIEWNLKANQVGKLIKHIDEKISRHKDYEKNQKERRIREEKRSDNLKKYLFNNMKEKGIKKIDNDLEVIISIRKGTGSVEIVNEEEIPEEFVKIIKQFDKIGLKKLLKEGKEIPGCKLIVKDNLTIK